MKFRESEIGKIPSHWDVTPIEKIGNVIGGGTPLTKKTDYYGGEIPWITPKDLSGYNRKKIRKGARNITQLGLDNSSAKLLPKDTVLLSSRAPIGYVAIAKNPVSTNQGFKSVVCDESKILPDYLYYVLKTSKHALESIASGSTFKEVSGKAVKGFKIPLPPLYEQQIISNILSSLDNKIDLNTSMISNIEQLAQALFKRWFINYEFPNENDKPYKSSGGKMVQSELGEIPEGWEVTTLGQIADFTKGYSYKGKYLSDDGIPMINLGNFSPDGKFNFEKLKYYTDESFKERHIVEYKDIVIANTDLTQKREVLGTPLRVPKFNSTQMFISHHVTSAKNLKVPTYFLYQLLKTKTMRDRMKSFATGTTVLAIPKDALPQAKFVNPTVKTMEYFIKIAKPLYEKIDILNKEITSLVELRDALLPKLLSGKIELSEENEVKYSVQL